MSKRFKRELLSDFLARRDHTPRVSDAMRLSLATGIPLLWEPPETMGRYEIWQQGDAYDAWDGVRDTFGHYDAALVEVGSPYVDCGLYAATLYYPEHYAEPQTRIWRLQKQTPSEWAVIDEGSSLPPRLYPKEAIEIIGQVKFVMKRHFM